VLRHAITSLLDRAGYHAAQAADGAEALRQLQQEPFDLLLLDIGLPGVNGLDVLAQVRTYPSPPRVVMMTADDTPARRIVELVGDVLMPRFPIRRTTRWRTIGCARDWGFVRAVLDWR
jgi:DNA-binding response OmpR family regulator